MKTIKGEAVLLLIVGVIFCFDPATAPAQSGPLSPKEVPASGTFWSVQNTNYPPLPWNPLPELPVYYLGYGNHYAYDDSSVDYDAIQEEQEAERVLRRLEWEAGLLSSEEYWALEGGGSMMMMSSLRNSYGYDNPVYLTNLVASITNSQPTVASFSIAGGTNNVPYDILTSTNVGSSVAQWNWLGLGYTSNRYTFSNQPPDQAFYILAKPDKTMVVAWGDNYYGQSDVPYGITNAVMAAGGNDFSLALLNNGTVVGWGDGSAPTNLVGVAMIACGWNHSVALLTNGVVTNWGVNLFGELNVPSNLTNAVVISAQALQSLALRSDGTVVAWGDNSYGNTNVPSGLSNVTAIAAGGGHNLAVQGDGTVAAWGWNVAGQCNVPAGASNVWDVAAGWQHSAALKRDGTVVAWGDNSYGETNVPTGLSNVVAIAAGGDPYSAYTLALKNDGTVAMWGQSAAVRPLSGLTGVFAIAGGGAYGLAIRSGPRTPVITLQPTDQYQISGGSVTFTAKGVGLYGVAYQWKTNGVNLAGATNATLALTNLQAAQAGVYAVNVSNEVGSILSSNANLTLVTPPGIISMTLPTNRVCIYGNILSFGVVASAPGQTNGFPLSYQWKQNGTNITDATNPDYSFAANDNSSGSYSVTVANAAGSTNVAWQVTVTNAINVTNDLLLIFNTNSTDSIIVKDYYLLHRPMVSGANVLGIGCATGEITTSTEFTNQIQNSITAWLDAHPTKRPQYVLLFLDIPSRVNDGGASLPSVSYRLHTGIANWSPFVTHINMNGTNDCKAYIDKLEYIGTNYSTGKLIISAGGYGNTNYYIDNVRHGSGFLDNYTGAGNAVWVATNGLFQAGVPLGSIVYTNGLVTQTLVGTNVVITHPPYLSHGTNVAGYIGWGQHADLGGSWPTDGLVTFTGNSGWYLIETIESFNGLRDNSGSGQSNFIQWFSDHAFGGTNYSNTPVGAVTHVEEPGGAGAANDPEKYFGLWAEGKTFAICAWASWRTFMIYPQFIGDPFVTK